MRQPAFTFWPWKVLAVSMPLIAALTVLVNHDIDETERVRKIAGIFYAVIGAGNGYMVAAAIGDFGRSIIAIPVGAGAALASVELMQLPILRVAVLGLLVLALLGQAIGKFSENPVVGGFFILVIGICSLGLIPAAGANNADGYTLGLVMVYPLVTGAVTVCMPAENTLRGRYAALITGFLAALYSMAGGLAVAFAGSLFINLIANVVGRAGQVALAATIAVLCAINFMCIHLLLGAAYRISVEPRGAAEPQDAPAPPAQADLPMASAEPAPIATPDS